MSSVIKVDMIRCEGHGYCAEILPERISLDDWGFPIVDPEPIPDEFLEHARRAVSTCPLIALGLMPVPGTRNGPRAEASPPGPGAVR